jgi:WW domain-binding protein 4
VFPPSCTHDVDASCLSGKWVTQEEAYKSVKTFTANVGQSSTLQTKAPTSDIAAPTIKGGPAPGRVVTKPLNPMRPIKGSPSATAAVTANKRKREDSKLKTISKEEEAALKAREAARKRIEEREKPLMGLYKSY